MNKRALGLLAVSAVLALTASAALAVASGPPKEMAWAFPGTTPPPKVPPKPNPAQITLAGSKAHFTEAQITDRYNVVDWYPDTHPPMPPLVQHGHGIGIAGCGYCHLPSGQGRPENAALAGLPAAYIIEQVADIHSGARGTLNPTWAPIVGMQGAAAAPPAEVAEAAAYFSKIPLRPHRKLVETDTIPAMKGDGYIYRMVSGPKQKLGERIVESPEHFDLFDHRDAEQTYIAYVPIGSVARGKALATTGGNGKTVTCSACHGDGFKGGLGPPIAGRSPTFLARELYSFHVGLRHGAGDATMTPVAAKLTVPDMIDLAAYISSLKP